LPYCPPRGLGVGNTADRDGCSRFGAQLLECRLILHAIVPKYKNKDRCRNGRGNKLHAIIKIQRYYRFHDDAWTTQLGRRTSMTQGVYQSADRTLIEKVWAMHRIASLGDETDLLLIDRIFLHERSGGRMLQGVAAAGRTVFDPNTVFATLDHIIDTHPGRTDQTLFPGGSEFIRTFRTEAALASVPIFDLDDPRQGIVHVIAPELGIALPGATIVCGDSHTSTVGGIGALAWGIGVTQGEHALTTQCLPVRIPKLMRVELAGTLHPSITAKDVVLALIGRYGAAGGRGHAIEFGGTAARSLPIEGRMTLCNMAVEFGAWTGIVAPDDATFDYLAGREYAPQGAAWEAALGHWRSLKSDERARYDGEMYLDCSSVVPMVTWGTSSDQVIGIDERIPDPSSAIDRTSMQTMTKALTYMALEPGHPVVGLPIQAAFIGSCTNARIDDLRVAANILRGRRVARGVRALCVPGSTMVKRQAEAEGLDRIFTDAGFEWRDSGCSLCFFAGGESFGDARRVISTTNRNFENRQGPGVRSHLASPLTVAASAVAGAIADPRRILDLK
jgi:3-isopropylmalate/(R)-2-methylmalate dehydratase large subunit